MVWQPNQVDPFAVKTCPTLSTVQNVTMLRVCASFPLPWLTLTPKTLVLPELGAYGLNTQVHCMWNSQFPIATKKSQSTPPVLQDTG
jgi:hypothetical protein